MHVRSEVLIAAPPQRVWELTADIEGWPALTPTITSVTRLDDGPLGVGSRARLVQPGRRPSIWTVTEFEEGLVFAWQTMVFGIPLTARHTIEAGLTCCRNVLTVDLPGRRGALLIRLSRRAIQTAIETENAGFRRAAQTRAG
jgi:uncharacterized membrane protein